MSNQKASLEIDTLKLESNINRLEKDMQQHPTRADAIKEEQAKLLQLFYKLRKVAFVKRKSSLISMVVNFIIFNTVALVISGVKGPIEFSPLMLITLFVCLLLANLFLLRAIKSWTLKQTIKTNQRIEDTKVTLLVLDDK